eukprot:TRINITY_DN453_c0_g1_i2.p1 TRINITY_DN453_c0_g1~~TRINITY_DN453_c0_g1_i2.p1  ORF type:complete len:155 (+),score=24.96 TRINITY_DN453_c0_g1_i2:153-617(+)
MSTCLPISNVCTCPLYLSIIFFSLSLSLSDLSHCARHPCPLSPSHPEPPFVRKTILGIIGFILKRARLQANANGPNVHSHLNNSIEQALKAADTNTRALGHELITAIITEYATPSPAVEMTHSEHARMALSFERVVLVNYVKMALERMFLMQGA